MDTTTDGIRQFAKLSSDLLEIVGNSISNIRICGEKNVSLNDIVSSKIVSENLMCILNLQPINFISYLIESNYLLFSHLNPSDAVNFLSVLIESKLLIKDETAKLLSEYNNKINSEFLNLIKKVLFKDDNSIADISFDNIENLLKSFNLETTLNKELRLQYWTTKQLLLMRTTKNSLYMPLTLKIWSPKSETTTQLT